MERGNALPGIKARFLLAEDPTAIQRRNLRSSRRRGSSCPVSPMRLWPDCSFVPLKFERFNLLKAEMCFLAGQAYAFSGLSKAIYSVVEEKKKKSAPADSAPDSKAELGSQGKLRCKLLTLLS